MHAHVHTLLNHLTKCILNVGGNRRKRLQMRYGNAKLHTDSNRIPGLDWGPGCCAETMLKIILLPVKMSYNDDTKHGVC